MSLNTEELARREFELLTSPDTIRVRVKVSQFQAFWLPDEEGDEEVEAIFKTMSFGDNLVIEKVCTYRIDNKQTRERRDEVDINEMRRLIVKRNLLSWSLPIPIVREGDWMTADCYRHVSSVAAPLMEALLDKYEERIQISKEDEELIYRQSAVLFSKSSRGVADACEAVSLFCTLGNYWEKFGLNRFTILNLPYREYLMLKIMIGKEGEAHRMNAAPKAPTSRIAMGHGGRTRPSRGIVQGS